MSFLPFKKVVFAAFVLLAGNPAALAQRAVISITDGGVINTSAVGKNAFFEGEAFDQQFTLKAGMSNPGSIGVGLFFEQAHFSKKQTFYQNNSPLTGVIAIAEPQRTYGIEVFTENYLNRVSYLRFGALFGYAHARIEDPTTGSGYLESQGLNYSIGGDISYVFLLGSRVSAVLNTGIRYSEVHYGSQGTGFSIRTYSFPLTAGVSYQFKGRQTPTPPAKS